jgi:hypothetical protein
VAVFFVNCHGQFVKDDRLKWQKFGLHHDQLSTVVLTLERIQGIVEEKGEIKLVSIQLN